MLYTPNCPHYEVVPLVDAPEEIRVLIHYALAKGEGEEVDKPGDSPAMREATRTLVGWGDNSEGQLCAAVCHDPQCYPDEWSNRHIAACEVFVHEVITNPVDDEHMRITATTVAGPQAYCRKVCYATTPHFYDIEVWNQDKDLPAFEHSIHMGGSLDNRRTFTSPPSPAGRKFKIVLRCENCHHGYDLVTKTSSPSRWRRLMKNETARKLLTGAVPDREPGDI